MPSFEEEIAYFYGAKETTLIAKHYLNALSFLKEKGSAAASTTALKSLTLAYEEVQAQTGLVFDPSIAAKWEYDLIASHQGREPFDAIVDLMTSLYECVFCKKSPLIQQAAWLRTFLYCYKNRLLNEPLSQEDQVFLLSIARKRRALLDELTLDKTRTS
jgi:hypothetical protein